MPAAITGMEHMRAMKLRIAVILLLTPMVVQLKVSGEEDLCLLLLCS